MADNMTANEEVIEKTEPRKRGRPRKAEEVTKPKTETNAAPLGENLSSGVMPEVTPQPDKEYVPIWERSERQLKELATKLNLNISLSLGREKLLEAIQLNLLVKQQALEDEARNQLKAKRLLEAGMKPGERRKPCLEELEIQKSKKVLVEFRNLENPGDESGPGVDIEFDKGGRYHFHLFDGLVHVMPECLVSSEEMFKKTSLFFKCVHPIYRQVEDKRQGITTPKIAGTRPRFIFSNMGTEETHPDIKDAPFGLYQKEISKRSDI